MSLFNVNTPFWQFMNKMADVFLLSLLWMLCSIPVVTFGAASTAFVTVSMKIHRNCEGSVMRDFFCAFRKNFPRATLMWLSHVAILLLLAADLWLCWQMKTKLGAFLLPVFAMLGLLYLMASFYTWPLISHTARGMLKGWKMAAHLTLTFLPHSLSMLVLALLGAFLAFLYPGLAILFPFIVCYQFARVYVWTFSRDPLVRELLLPSARYCLSGAKSAENKTGQDNKIKSED